MVKPTTPFSELSRTFERMQETVEEMAQSWDGESIGTEPPVVESIDVDLEDADDAFVLIADLPGFEPDDIDVRVVDGRLRIEAERESVEETEAGEYVRRERTLASAVRSISLPEPVETSDVSATHDNGVLTVRLPKREPEPAETGTEIDIH